MNVVAFLVFHVDYHVLELEERRVFVKSISQVTFIIEMEMEMEITIISGVKESVTAGLILLVNLMHVLDCMEGWVFVKLIHQYLYGLIPPILSLDIAEETVNAGFFLSPFMNNEVKGPFVPFRQVQF